MGAYVLTSKHKLEAGLSNNFRLYSLQELNTKNLPTKFLTSYGLGFVPHGTSFTVFDLDHCVDYINNTFTVHSEALQFINFFSNPYVEISPSGHGLHVFTIPSTRSTGQMGPWPLEPASRNDTRVPKLSDIF
jgi:hypothetical protein